MPALVRLRQLVFLLILPGLPGSLRSQGATPISFGIAISRIDPTTQCISCQEPEALWQPAVSARVGQRLTPAADLSLQARLVGRARHLGALLATVGAYAPPGSTPVWARAGMG